MRVALCQVDALADNDRGDLHTLSLAVYPPEVSAAWPGRHLEWAAPEWCVCVRAGDGTLASYVGIVLRQATWEGRPVQVGGIGGVKTHPAMRGQGFAGWGIRRAVQFFHERGDVAFGLLVCQPHLIGYYQGLGWREFTGQLLVVQHGEATAFRFNRVMTVGVRSPGPVSGTIDLLGPPW